MIRDFTYADFDEYRTWVNAHPEVYVWNVGHRRLHRASCNYRQPRKKVAPDSPADEKLGKSNAITKVYADTKEEIVQRVPEARDSNRTCGTCKP